MSAIFRTIISSMKKKSINTKQLSKIYIDMREGMGQAGQPLLTSTEKSMER
jgi:hypothetical protein